MLRFAIIGTGFMGETHARCLSSIENVKLTAIVSRDPDTGKDFARNFGSKWYTDYETMLEDDVADVVDICLPSFLHEEAVIKAAEKHKHIFCEKPVALSLDSLDRMIKVVEEAGVRFAVGHVVRFWPENELIKAMYDSGDFGIVRTVYASRLSTHPSWSDWFKDPRKSGGGLFDLHIHDTDYLCHTFGKVKRVFAQGIKNERGCWNHVSSTLDFKNGIRAVIESCIEMPKSYPMTTLLRVIGSNKAVEYTMRAGENLEDIGAAVRQTIEFSQDGEPEKLNIPDKDAYYEELKYFSESILKDRKMSKLTIESIIESLEVISAIKKSLETGELVEL